MEKQENDFYEVLNIVRKGTNHNKFTDKDEIYIICQMGGVEAEKKINGRPVYGGDTIGKTFLEKSEGGWTNRLKRVLDEDDEYTYKDLPLYEGFIHEHTTRPYYIRKKDKHGDLQYAKIEDGEDKGQRAIGDKFRMLLGARDNKTVAVADFLGRQKMVDMAEVDASAYTTGGKAYNILELAGGSGAAPPESANDEKE
jgi:hypothetical protein